MKQSKVMLKNKIKTNHSDLDQFVLKYKLVPRPWPTHQIQYFDAVPNEAPNLDKTRKKNCCIKH